MSDAQTIREALYNVAATLRGMMSDDAIARRIDLAPEIEQCEGAVAALDRLVAEAEQRT